MKIIKLIVVMATVLACAAGRAGYSDPFILDTTKSLIRNAIPYNSSWVGGDVNATVVIADNGIEIKRFAGEGEFIWSPTTPGRHTLTYTTYIDEVAQNEVYETDVYAVWKYSVTDGRATIVETIRDTGCIMIPSEIDEYPVCDIGENVFKNCNRIEKVVIPSGVKTILDGAFTGCSNILDVSIGRIDISTGLPGFYEAEFTSMSSFDDSIPIVENNKGIVLSADMLTADTTDEYTMYGYAAEMFFEGGVEYSFLAYYDDKSSVKIDGVTVISAASSECASQTYTVKYDESGWHSLELRGWNNGGYGAAAYGSCRGILWKKGSGDWKEFADSGDGSQFRISGGRAVGMKGVFPDSYNKLTNVVLTGEISKIPANAFSGCSSLTSFVIPEGIEEIGDCAFDNCASLGTIKIPDCVYAIGGNAFANCTGLKQVSIPIGLKTQVESGDVFSGCSDELEIVYRTAEIKNVTAKQRYPWNGKVDVTFEVDGNLAAGFAEENLPVLSIIVSNRVDGAVYVSDAITLSGDTGLAEGTHRVVWDLDAQEIELCSDEVEIYVIYQSDEIEVTRRAVSLRLDAQKENPVIAKSLGAVLNYNSSWIGSDSSATVVITDNGTEIKRTTGEGEFTWTPTTIGKHTLTYTTFIDGVAQDEVYETVVYADWKYTVEDGKATIVETTQTSGDVTILSEIDGCPVVAIGDGVFKDCNGLMGVTIPNSVTNIGYSAFGGCTGIRKVSCSSIPDGLSNPGLIQVKFNNSDDFESLISESETQSLVSGVLMGYAYDTQYITRTYTDPVYGGNYQWNSQNTTFGYSGYMYMVGGRTYVFGKYFDDSVYVKIEDSIVLQDTNHESFSTGTYIPSRTGWYKLEVRVSDGVGEKGPKGNQTSWCWGPEMGIGWRDDGITDALPESAWNKMMDPGDGMLFRSGLPAGLKALFPDSYDKLTEVVLMGNAEQIPANAFSGCSSLTSFVIPEGVQEIGEGAFSGCTSLESIEIPEGIQIIGADAFYGCSSLVDISFVNSNLTKIPANAFVGCSSLTSFVIPESVQEIGEGAFCECTSLESVEIPNGVGIIKANAFCECESLETAFIPMTVTNLSANTFKSCSSLKQVDLPILFMGKMNFDGCPSDLVARYHCVVRLDPVDGTLKDDDLMLDVVYGDIYGELPIPGGARTGYHFGCWTVNGVDVYLNSVVNTASNHTLVAKWTANEYKVFLDATGGVIDGDSVKDVVYDGAYGELPVPSCEGYVFVGWTLNGVAIDDTTVVKTAGDHTLVATWGIQIGNGVWSATICDDAIVLDEPLIEPTGDVTIPAEIAGRPVVGITADAFAGNGDITGIHIPDSVTDIEEGAFDGCTGIRSVHIPYVTDESQWMAKYFSDSYANITNVVLGDSVGRIGDSFFTGCEALSSVSLPAGLTNIARTAFSGCSNIAEVTWCSTNIWTENVILPRPINVVKIFRNRWGQFFDENDNPINNSYISPRISDDMSTNMWAEVYFEEGGEYTFSWYVRSEENCDFLNLYVDGQYVDGISGFMRTRQAFTVELSPGEHILTWAYEKDGSVSEYSDRSYIYADEMNEFDDCKMGFGELFADSKESLRVLSFAEGVVSLPDGCLTRLEAVERVELPSTLEKFGDNDLRSLSKVENGFWIEQGWVLGYMGTARGTVEIPEGVKGIASYAFEGQTLLDNVTLPSTLKYVGVNAFKSCTNLEDIDLPEGVVRVEDGAFRNCTYAQTVKLPSSLQEIGDSAFENCTSFSGVECPDALKIIGEGAFSNCWRMLSVSLPVGLESVGTNAFLDCRRLIGVSVPTHLNTMKELFPSAYANLTTVEIAEGENALVSGIFAGCAALTEVDIHDGIRVIPEDAFVGCLAVQSFNLPNTITNIGARAFSGLTQMASFAFPAEIETIGDEAFAGCANLASLSLPEGVKHIGSRAFDGLALLARADIPGTVVEMGETPFAGCGQIRAVSMPGNVATVKSLFPDAYGEIVSASVTVGTTCVGERLFADCSKLTSVDLPSTLVEIGECAFENCALLADAGIPAGVERLGEGAFLNCASLAKIALPNGLVTVPYQAFAGCEALAEIVIPENVSELEDSVFLGCSRLSKVYFVGNAPSCTASSYDGVPASLVTYVENGSTGWDGIETSKTLPEFWPEGTSNLITYWTPNRYDVTFDLSGGGDAFDVEQVTGTTYILPPDPERQGAVFDGWWTSADVGARVTAVTSVDLTRPHTFYARWKYNTYSVVFDANGGSGEMEEQRLTVETSAQLAENGFTRPGYAFLGWATEPEGEAVYPDKAEVINLAYDNNAIVTLYAVWSEREWTWADAVNATSSGLVFSGDVNNDVEWAIDYSTSHDGVVSLRSGVIGASAEYPERTMSTVKTEVVGEGTGEFWWKVNCEEMDAEYDEWYDYVVFTIDGEEVAKIAGDSGWQKVEYIITGAGKHTLAWTFTRDDYDEEGVGWENAAWLDEFVWTPNPVTVTFDAGGADGDVPDPVVKYAGYELTLPGAGTLNNGEYVFRGWSDGETTYQAGGTYVFGSVDVTLTAVWELKVWTFAEAADVANISFTTGGDVNWAVDTSVGYTNGVSVKSGAITNGESTWIETKVNGAGTLTFRWKVMGGQYRNNPFAFAKVVVDDTEITSECLTDGWEDVTIVIEGNNEHVIRWTYLRTSTRTAEGDCAWIDAVSWTPSAVAEPIPALPSTATAAEVAAALSGSADAKLAANITDAVEYAAYRTWALGIAGATLQQVKDSAYAWLSYALNTAALIAAAPKEGDVVIDTFENAATDGAFEFTVKIDGIEVGENALGANLRKVFEVEGAETLANGGAGFSSDNVEVNAAAPENGNVKFTVTPKTGMGNGEKPNSFFFRVKMK